MDLKMHGLFMYAVLLFHLDVHPTAAGELIQYLFRLHAIVCISTKNVPNKYFLFWFLFEREKV